uniref:Uncharacterized protein n=1 Tax=Anopheles culicifacies TaxID=139723 RepID=A0A182M2I5_9DIPT
MEVSKRYLWLAAFQLFWFMCLVESYPDGANLYKDWLRGKNEEDVERMIAEDQFEAPKLYMMLTKDSLDVPLIDDVEQTKEATRFFFPRVNPKRSPGAILSWAIPAANRVRVISTNYRPPGINRPAA